MTASTAERLNRARRGVGVSGHGPGAPAPRRKSVISARAWTLLAFALPSLLLLLLINLYPVIYAGIQSIRNGDLINAGDFVGFANYASVLSSPQFWSSAQFTLIFTISGVFGSWAVGLALALLLRTRIPAGNVFKVLLLLPWIVPVVVSATSWNFLVATPQSPIPILFTALGMPNVLFLASPVLAQVTVCIFKIWISFPFMMMMMASALASVDVNVYEAAKMDGASTWQTFRGVTLPIISRSTYISWILMTIFCVNDFPTIFLLTGGGPVNSTTSLVVLAYRTVFQNFQVGPGVAIAFLMTFVLVVISVVLYRQIRKVNVE
ncbi:MAG: multiple sugar transport system permease protein [Actinomycetota bacterium]|jgi:multiple sugar transport system permease protein|nr:transporter [Glaciihabitans sp.]MDQ1544614.1 multiple sugar transport system permease protein [Actinomycetota bacterium]MDQ1561674.1 multiple sugar transport system permease protein [Actinomycetota bacterium]MDQ1573529.1 multiple sugar transport system permease protein [Actinomycetota bacterium]